VSTVTGTVDTRPIVEFFVVKCHFDIFSMRPFAVKILCELGDHM